MLFSSLEYYEAQSKKTGSKTTKLLVEEETILQTMMYEDLRSRVK